MDWQIDLRPRQWRKSLPTPVTHNPQARAHQIQTTGTGSDATASTSTASGNFKDFMDSFVAGLDADPSNGGAGTGVTTTGGQANANGILALLAKLGIKPGEAETTPDGAAATSDTKKIDATDASGVVVPVVAQPQLALGFGTDGGLVETAAQKAITAATSGTPGAGLLVNAISNALGGSGETKGGDGAIAQAATSAQATVTGQSAAAAQTVENAVTSAQTTVATQTTGTPPANATALTDQTAAAAQTVADAAAKAGDSAGLAAQGVVSIAGKAVVADAAHTVANQTAPKADDTASNTAHVALTALQQSANLATTPISRAADIRSKLQPAQLGAGKTSAVGASEVGASSGTTMGDALAAQATGTPATAATSGLLDATARQQLAQFGDKSSAANSKSQDQVAASTTDDKSQLDGSGSTFSDRLNAQFNANLSGLNQGQTTQSPAQAGATSQSVPYAALASTLVSHAKAGSSEFNIRLDPAGLGQIDVKMKVSSDGQVRAHLIVDQPATLDLMMRDRQNLQQQLDQAGFKTDGSSLQFSLRDQGQGSSQQQAWQQQDGSSRAQSRATTVTDSTGQLPSAVYARQSYIRTDAVDISI